MYLKSLQVVGFKSFADKTLLEFHRGVTAIVGPNGCGKSNVLDSIRWVLGEQSAKALRGGEMKDVIFSGTDTRSALGMAEVSLTFADCEGELGTAFNEVTVTRRIFRDGAAEYEINKTPCRLRDVNALFMDTGIGRTAYSIMEQGKIDQILSSRPEDRRAIFEEAAGITKYKSQRKEALRKLENTEANLLRLADIIREVKRQIGSLQRQAGKARRYQTSFEELAGLELRLGRYQFDTSSATIKSVQENVRSARETQEKLGVELAEQEKKVTEFRVNLAAVEAELGEWRNRQNQAQNARERAQQRASTNLARVEEFQRLGEQAGREIESTQEKIQLGEEQLRHLTSQVEHFKSLRSATEEKVQAAGQEVAQMARKISALRGELGQVENHKLQQERLCQRQEQDLAALTLQQQNFRVRLESLQAEQVALAERLEETRLIAVEHGEKLKADEAHLAEKRDALQAGQHARREAEESWRSLERTRNEELRAQQTLQARRDALAQLQQQQANAPQATQRLLKEQIRAGEEGGTLAQHLNVQVGYEKPLALLLGDAIHALVLADTASAQQWREKLTANEQCQFAPLALPRPASLPDCADTLAGKFVTAPEQVQNLVAALLEEAHVVDNLTDAWALKTAQPQATVATKQGELITRSGLLIIGRDAGATLAVFTRQAELRKLETDLAERQRQGAEAQAAVDQAQAVFQEKAAEVEKLRAALQQAEISVATQRQDERNARAALDQLGRQVDQVSRDLARVVSQQQVDTDRQEKLQEAIRLAQTVRAEAEEKLAQLKVRLDEMLLQENAGITTLTERRIELAGQTHQAEAWQQQREPVARRLQELRELITTRTREAQDHAERVTQARREIIAAEEDAANQQAGWLQVGVKIEAAQQVSRELQGQIDALEHELRAQRKQHGEGESVRATMEVRLAEQNLLLTSLRERFRRDHHKELEDLPVLTNTDLEVDWTALEMVAAEKRAALEALGPVNLEAITEYDELEQRHQFLTGQETDLITAKTQLVQAIKEINQTTQRLFADTFEQVKKNFQEMFTELFGGGKASLVLLDEAEPLECGIDIIARPPGKQTQNISLLSGGEKTMTAVALLFSIYLVKPSPFCVLDEMDAPLDESNINRFIKILQRFVHQSQFMVITHNKRTISMADVLYGVTMQERGVSRIVSVRLQKNERADHPEQIVDSQRDDAVPSLAEAVSG